MRYTSNHKAETRQRILGEAARRFRKDGIEGTGLVPLMKALGLTHGGFYAHFESKDALVQASLDTAIEQTVQRWEEPCDDAARRAFVASYLSAAHRDEPGDGCPLSSLSAELGLRGQPSSETDALVARLAARLENCTMVAPREDQGIVALAAMVGALTLARGVSDPATSNRILAAVTAAIQPQAVQAVPQRAVREA
jgi:TetR/AcrR family transcriptional regulator, transcriptional repressor for nem operon